MRIDDLRIAIQNQRLRAPAEPRPPSHVGEYAAALRMRPPARTALAVAVPRRYRSDRDPVWDRVIAVAGFKYPFSVIEEFAKSLAPMVAEFGVVPEVIPMQWQYLEASDPTEPLVSAMIHTGIILFDKLEADR